MNRVLQLMILAAMMVACGQAEDHVAFPAQCVTDKDCASNNPCLEDKCIASVCASAVLPDGAACDDENICTLVDSCRSGNCVGQELDLQVIVQYLCLLITCDPQEGYAVGFQPDGTPCAFGQCAQGVCIPTAEKSAN